MLPRGPRVCAVRVRFVTVGDAVAHLERAALLPR